MFKSVTQNTSFALLIDMVFLCSVDVNNATIRDVRELGVVESYKSKLSQLCSAAEAAEMVSFLSSFSRTLETLCAINVADYSRR